MAQGSTDIRYVCVSDLHLGEEDSLLTYVPPGKTGADPTLPSPVLKELAACLKFLINSNQDQTSKPTLIMNGDILELALTNDNVAAMAFDRFLEEVMPPGGELFGKIMYIPGNHDHHLWESARETQYVLNYLPETDPKKNKALDIPWHATNIFMEDDPKPVKSFFLNGLVKRYKHLKDFTIYTAYPNFGLRKGSRAVIFHHGHFIESIYQLMTTLKNLIFPKLETVPRKVWDLEAENFAWIDFFWSTLGRSGEVGQDVEIIYEKMRDEQQFRKLLNTLAKNLADKYNITGMGEWIDSQVTKWIINGLVNKIVKTERAQGDWLLSKDAADGLIEYMNQPLKRTLDNECQDKHYYFPRELTFVFGHTHKPFEKMETEFRAYLGNGVPVYNTGGWVVETEDPAPLHGAAVTLLNENLDVASLRLYNEAADAGSYRVGISEVPLPGNGPSDFFRRLQGLVHPTLPPWDRFSQTVAAEVSIRARNLRDRINA